MDGDDVGAGLAQDAATASSALVVVASPPSASALSTARPRRVVNRSRQRLQHELASLRQQQIALQEQLAVITRGGAPSRPAGPVLLQAWRTVAWDQQQQVHEAAREREQLRRAIQDQKRFLKRVRRFVRERIVRNEQFQALVSSRLAVVLAMDVPGGYREVARQLERMQLQADVVFWGPRAEPEPYATFTCDRDVFELPFDARTVAEAAWLGRLRRVARVSTGVEEERARGAENMVRCVFSAVIHFPTYKGELFGLEETRRVVDGDRHYILQCLLSSRADRPEGSSNAAGFEFCTRSWIVVSPVTTSDANVYPISRVETLEVTCPSRRTRQLGEEALVEAQAYCRGAAAYARKVERQLIENALLDLARQDASREKCRV